MRKTLLILMTIGLILPLTACTNKQSSTQADQAITTIQKNSHAWQQKTKDLPVVKYDEFTESPGFIAKSMDYLTQTNKHVVKGTVYNLTQLDNVNNRAYTKVTLHVDEVINGSKKLHGQNINLVMYGGITNTNSWYKNKNQTREADHDILVQYTEFPLPAVGSEMIIGISPSNSDEPTDYMKTIKQNKLDLKNTYDIGMPEYNIWIKNAKDKEFHLNNPLAAKKLSGNSEMKKGVDQLTKELNQKYNK